MNHAQNGSAGMISVITPVYNSEKYIERAVRSVLNQTYRDIEYILVDDGSTDKSGEIIDRYAAQDSRIRVIHRKNGGVAAARNTGLSAARGEYIAWLDSDDWLEPSMLETCLNALLKNNAEAALCNYKNIASSGRETVRNLFEGDCVLLDNREALEWLFASKISSVLWANVIRRSAYEDIVFPEGRTYEDVLTVYRIYERADLIVVMNAPLLNRQLHPGSITGDLGLKSRTAACNAHIDRQMLVAGRWPQLDRVFAANRYVQLLKLRRAVVHSPLKEWFLYRKDIRRFTAFFRKNGKYVLEQFPGTGPKLEFFFLTSGTLPGFWLSRIVSLPKKGGTWLKK